MARNSQYSGGSGTNPSVFVRGETVSQAPTATLADLYDPVAMPAPLLKAHQALDRAVDRCYRKELFTSDSQRVEFLFALYEKLTAPLLPVAKSKRTRRGGEGKIRP